MPDARFETIRWYLDRRDDAAGWVALESVEAELAFDHRARLELEAELAQVKDELARRTRAMYEAHDADHAELQRMKDALAFYRDASWEALQDDSASEEGGGSIARAALEGTDPPPPADPPAPPMQKADLLEGGE